jgi:RNA polymerase sigma factor (sigma-70 family)
VSGYVTASLIAEPNLVIQTRAGDADAFAVLYETQRPRNLAICLRMTNNMAEAEDPTQDAFIYAFRKLSTFRGESAFSTWLLRVAANTVFMHFRRKGNRHASLDESRLQDSDSPKSEYGRVDENLAGCADRLSLAQALEEFLSATGRFFCCTKCKGMGIRRYHCVCTVRSAIRNHNFIKQS